jgi:hypothetical protein
LSHFAWWFTFGIPKSDSAMARWYVDENATVRWWKHNGTNVKQRLYDSETTKARWWKRDRTMVKADVTMVKIRWHDMMKLLLPDDENAILFSLSCHRIIVISPSCHRVLIIVPSTYHLNFTFVPLCIVTPHFGVKRTLGSDPKVR